MDGLMHRMVKIGGGGQVNSMPCVVFARYEPTSYPFTPLPLCCPKLGMLFILQQAHVEMTAINSGRLPFTAI
jgi:hypothetical protein